MASAGDFWFEALSNVGKNIGRGIEQYHQRHDEIDQVEGTLKLFSQLGMGDNGQLTRAGKFSDHTVDPIIPPEIFDEFSHYTGREKAKQLGAMEALMKFQYNAAGAAAKARLKSEIVGTTPDFVHTPQGTFFKGSKGWQRIPGETQGQAGVEARFQQKELDRGISGIQKELQGADITDPEFLLESDRHKAGYMKGDTFVPSTDNQTHIQVETDDGTVVMPNKKFQHLKRKAQEWKKFKAQKTMPQARTQVGGAGDNVPVMSPEQAMRAPPGTIFRTLDGRIKKVPSGFSEPAAEDNGSDSTDE